MTSLLRILVGAMLIPTSVFSLAIAASTLAALARSSSTAAPLMAGAAFCLLLRLFTDMGESHLGRGLKRLYVLGHELSHALAAWASGAKVYGIKIGAEQGHVDLSHSNALIALAPYALPFHAAFVILAYRIVVWQRPDWSFPTLYLVLLGAALAFHLIFTFDCLWGRDQPDIKAAGGAIFALPIIAMANALIVLVLLKFLFPNEVTLSHALSRIGLMSLAFWRKVGRPALAAFKSGYG